MRTVGVVPPDVQGALGALDRIATLEDVLAWCHARGGELVEVIVQDEYTHDVIVRGPAPAYLCFDTT